MKLFKGLRNALIINASVIQILVLAFSYAVLAQALFADTTDIIQAEDRPNVTHWRLDTVKILAFTETAVITYRKGFIEDSQFVGTGREKKVIFKNEVDNPETPENEFSDEYTQFINFIEINKAKIKQAVKIKLGLK